MYIIHNYKPNSFTRIQCSVYTLQILKRCESCTHDMTMTVFIVEKRGFSIKKCLNERLHYQCELGCTIVRIVGLEKMKSEPFLKSSNTIVHQIEMLNV